MSYEAKIIADSVNPDGVRLTTMQVTYPRYIHSEMMTHRVFSRNASSSRAIPVKKMLERVQADTVMPIWTQNQAGMQGGEAAFDIDFADYYWKTIMRAAVEGSKKLSDMGAHKQNVNRAIEPFMWITVVITSTQWAQFFKQRCHPDAQPEIRVIAEMMRDILSESVPILLDWGQDHLPYITAADRAENHSDEELRHISVARCARTSYLSQEGVRDAYLDLDLFDKLINGGHWSPFEHVATAKRNSHAGNFVRGWQQYRKLFISEFIEDELYVGPVR